MPPNTSKELFRRYVGIWETGKLDGLGAILHDDYVSGAQGCEETLEARWIDIARPSRRPLRGLLRMRNFLSAIKDPPPGLRPDDNEIVRAG